VDEKDALRGKFVRHSTAVHNGCGQGLRGSGLGLGVHVTVNPKDAQSYFVTDGQKDIAACFDRTTSKVKAALKSD